MNTEELQRLDTWKHKKDCGCFSLLINKVQKADFTYWMDLKISFKHIWLCESNGLAGSMENGYRPCDWLQVMQCSHVAAYISVCAGTALVLCPEIPSYSIFVRSIKCKQIFVLELPLKYHSAMAVNLTEPVCVKNEVVWIPKIHLGSC